MIKATVIALGLVSSTVALAQPAKPTPAPAPAPGKTPATGEKADTSETLQSGGSDRPWADGVPQDRQQAAYKLFQEGNAQLNDGLFKAAVDKYREALKSWDHPAIHYNMALALMNLDQPIEVHDSLTAAIKYGAAPLEKDKYEHAKEYLLLIEKQLAEVEVSCDKVGAKVSVDGKEVFTVEAGKPNRYRAMVRIGKHTFVAEKTGYNAQIDAPFIEPGQKFRIELKLYTAEELTRYKRRWSATWMPYAVIGAGAVVGLAAGALELSAQSSFDEYDAAVTKCSMEGACEASGSITSLRDSGDTKRTLGYIGYGLAGATVATGVLLIYLNRETSYQITADEYRRDSRAVSVAPIVTPGMAGAVIHGKF
ncbi:MAG TPA: hypothetical protein VFQ53_38450 [Kofleriaceae bacterium]|nr:hypothetical protein [Kofleriaceae bacterium]